MNSAPDNMKKRISVRRLVEFILREGSIDSGVIGRNRMEEGARVHRKLQKAEGYQAEVYLKITETHAGIEFTVEGRADGVIVTEGGVTVDEIKSTLTPLELIDEDFSNLHWAQAMCYGHIYCVTNDIDNISIRLTYYEMDTGGIKRFSRSFSAGELRAFFDGLLDKFAVWARFEDEWNETATSSMRALKFPFDNYREGQRKMAAAVYKTIEAEGRLFAMAPTGVGKTISTLFPAIKARGEGLSGKIFYLTAKTITRQAAQAALGIMRGRGLRVKSAALTAKDKLCFLDERNCTPSICKYADGHYDRVNDAIMEVLRCCDDITADTVAEFAERRRVCPFELMLDLSLWCDVVICDYNYLFDPQVRLRRFFSDSGDHVFLVDEAHNLADRAREMYSAQISKRDLLAAKRQFGKRDKKVRAALTGINKLLLDKRRECETAGFKAERDAFGELLPLLEAFAVEFSKWLGENPSPDKSLLETYFNVLSYLKISEIYDERYVTLFEAGRGGENPRGGELIVKQFCADPSRLLDECLSLGRAAVLFSATLTPAGYFTTILGGGENCKYLALPSPFERENLLLLVAGNIRTKYKDRDSSLESVADMIYQTAAGKSGNYIAYFPSYSYLDSVYEVFRGKYPEIPTVRQARKMSEDEREGFLSLFGGVDGETHSQGESPTLIEEPPVKETLVAFCVLGGIFSEGIDLAGEKLIGTVIVGVGLPQINAELDVVRDQFGGGSRGFDFAYCYPGMNKVLQAAGRVIRSGQDRGVVLLVDERFATRRYTGLFPEHWKHWRAVRSADELSKTLAAFWG